MPESLPDATLERLVRRAQQGSQDAWADLVTAHYGLVHTIAYARLGDPEATEDLVQEVFLRAYLQLGQLRKPASFPFWTGRMARHLGMTWRRNSQRRSQLLPLVSPEDAVMEGVKDTRPSPADEAEAAEQRRRLHEAVDGLPPQEREATLLHYVDGMPKNAVAKQMGVHPATIGRMLDRACERLREGLGAADVAPRVRALEVPRKGPAAALSCAASVAALSPGAREALVAAAAKGLPAVVSAQTSTSVGTSSAGLLALLWESLQATLQGVFVMGSLKSSAVITAGVATVAIGTFSYVQVTKDSPAAVAAVAASPAGAVSAALESSIWRTNNPYRTVGSGWRFEQSSEAQVNGQWVPQLSVSGTCKVLSADASRHSTVALELTDVAIPPEWGASAEDVLGKTLYVDIDADGRVVRTRIPQGESFEPVSGIVLLTAVAGADLGPLGAHPQMEPGADASSQYRFDVPTAPHATMSGQMDYHFRGIETREGTPTAIFDVRLGSEMKGRVPVIQDNRTRMMIAMEHMTTMGSGEWAMELGDEPVARMTAEGTNPAMAMNMILAVPGQQQPVVRPVPMPPGQRWRTSVTFTGI